MSSVVRSWVRVFCPRCGERKTFYLGRDWVLRCEGCGEEKSLKRGLLVREPLPAGKRSR